MPAFTFEKISPKRGGAPITKSQPKKRASKRGLIVQVLDRLAEGRVKKSLREERGAIAGAKSSTSD